MCYGMGVERHQRHFARIAFQIVGRGATYEEDMALARELGLDKVRFLDPIMPGMARTGPGSAE